VQMTLLEAGAADWADLSDEDRVPWLRRILANNLTASLTGLAA
jgi:hypothetical protein